MTFLRSDSDNKTEENCLYFVISCRNSSKDPEIEGITDLVAWVYTEKEKRHGGGKKLPSLCCLKVDLLFFSLWIQEKKLQLFSGIVSHSTRRHSWTSGLIHNEHIYILAASQQGITGLKTLCGVVVYLWQLASRPPTSEVWTKSPSRRKEHDCHQRRVRIDKNWEEGEREWEEVKAEMRR